MSFHIGEVPVKLVNQKQALQNGGVDENHATPKDPKYCCPIELSVMMEMAIEHLKFDQCD